MLTIVLLDCQRLGAMHGTLVRHVLLYLQPVWRSVFNVIPNDVILKEFMQLRSSP